MTVPSSTDAVGSELSEQDYINSFSKRILREKTGNFQSRKRSRSGATIYDTVPTGTESNWGNKLLQKSECVTRSQLYQPNLADEDKIYYNGSEHSILQRGHGQDLDEFDLNKMVNVRQILTPVASLAAIVRKKSTARTFSSKRLGELSLKTVLMLEREQDSVIRYSRLLDVFLGEYPRPLYEKTLKLKDYDHNLTLPEDEEGPDAPIVKAPRLEPAPISSPNESTTVLEQSAEDIANSTIEPEVQPKSARNSPLASDIPPARIQEEEDDEDDDPFFALPQITQRDGLELLVGKVQNFELAEQMEITRQMAQIALQRNDEFIRNLKKIRNFIDKANRVRSRILSWSREACGIQDEGVTVPNVLSVVKRGLISATTNRSMRGQDDEEGRDDTSSGRSGEYETEPQLPHQSM
ncbi:Rxt2p KNAG_0J02500 [Huiozyma naganishii CBS 8797]|uniref:Transcriptional regulatory protein RXT2 N-terminal domain-containing protein n=1 Tax=Huiozyma naganishii (strain ATCC MYA-139 / BCRC 22969 / CBS 8797 / KCTC 17520 / NBRC 10181 / NCYC 3082 / Yp74L-3) TaxID=1071383 RepID=J7S9W1_HUIN7|nr:hypothetical protein KNAG_0J02500 [Kazachstania naganishii CBS 8797]CCK72329.1 hypothetical protein KNAG_0J02500 [Kazachstania naganishii CBS 8797]